MHCFASENQAYTGTVIFGVESLKSLKGQETNCRKIPLRQRPIFVMENIFCRKVRYSKHPRNGFLKDCNIRQVKLAAAICPFTSLLLSSRPVLVCMISEAKEAVDHTTWKTLPILFQQQWQLIFLQHCAKVMISNFPDIRQNQQISGGNIGKIWFIFCFTVGEFSRSENCRCEYSFSRDENSAQNER